MLNMINVLVEISKVDDFNKFSRFFSTFWGVLGHKSVHDFLAHLSTECSVSHCDHSTSFVVRPSIGPSDVWPSVRSSVHNLLVNTLASTNINQSSLNLVKMYMTRRAQMRSITELIGLELSELSALELENLPNLTMFTL